MIRRIASVCLALALVTIGVSYAQGVQTATVTGTVTGPDGAPLPGVLVTATSPVSMGERTAVTEENGGYVIRGLTPGEYTIRFHLEGLAPVEATATLELGLSKRVDAELAPPVTQAETIVVTAEAAAPLENTTNSTNLAKKTIDQLPLLQRRPIDIAKLASAVSERTPNTGQISINGSLGYDNSILIDGVSTQDPVFGGSDNLFIEDAVLETQVLTSGISAEYGAFTGGVINVITQSGGNDFAGSLRADLSRPDWRDETPFEDDRGIERQGDVGKIYSATLGGPVVRDRLWFFLSGRDTEATQVHSLLSGENVNRVTDNQRWQAKLSAKLTAGHDLQATYTDNDSTVSHNNQINPLELNAMARNTSFPNDGFAVNYTGVLSDNLFAEARYSQKAFQFLNSGGSDTNPRTGSPFVSTARGPFAGNVAGRVYNAPFFDSTDPEDRDNEQLAGALSYFLATDSLGSHDLKAGAERLTVTRTGGNSQTPTGFQFSSGYVTAGGQPVFDANGRLIPRFVPGISGTRLVWWIPQRGSELDITTDSFFLNDRWLLNDRFTATLGVRHEQTKSESTGGLTVFDTTNTVPRVGVSFDPLANGKYKLGVTYAEYVGRYNPALTAGTSPVGNPAYIYLFYAGPPGQGIDFAPGFDPNNYALISAGDPTQNVIVDSGLSAPINEEVTLSAGMALPRGGYVELTYVDREMSDFIEDFFTLDLGCSDVVLVGTNFGCQDNRLLANSDAPQRTYKAVALQGRYDILSNWRIEGSYTHQLENDGTYPGELGQQIFPSAIGDYPEILTQRNEPSGRLSQFQEHRIRMWTTYALDLGRAGDLDAALVYRYDSPQTFSFVSSNFPTTPTMLARDPGYANPPGSANLYFGERGSGEFEAASYFDTSLTYSLPIFRRVEPWVQLNVTNVLNEDALIQYNTSIIANVNGPLDADGLPTTFTRSAAFGTARNAADHSIPREYFFAAGIRF